MLLTADRLVSSIAHPEYLPACLKQQFEKCFGMNVHCLHPSASLHLDYLKEIWAVQPFGWFTHVSPKLWGRLGPSFAFRRCSCVGEAVGYLFTAILWVLLGSP